GQSIIYLNTADLSCETDQTVVNGIPFGTVGTCGSVSFCDDETACNYTADVPIENVDNSICEFESCAGCTDPMSCHYDETATLDDGSCDEDCPGCTDVTADNYDPNATQDDGSCIFIGCTDQSACNYDPQANQNEGCDYACAGCTDPGAFNYNAEATSDDGSCSYGPLEQVYVEEVYTDDGSVQGYPTGHTTYRIYARLNDPSFQMSAVFAIMDCTDMFIRTSTSFHNNTVFGGTLGSQINPALFGFSPDLEYDSWLTIGMDSTEDEGSVQSAFTQPLNPLENSFFQVGNDFEVIDGAVFTVAGQPNGFPDENGDVLLGQVTTDGDLSFKINLQILLPGNVDIRYLSTPGCISGENEIDGSELGLIYPYALCDNPSACNFTPNADPESVDNSVCDFDSCTGCTDPFSCHFDMTATIDDGSCNDACPGCTDPTAFNYDEQADLEDGSCLYVGCAYPNANNYNADADIIGLEYCDIDGCTDPNALNYNMVSNGNGECLYDCENPVVLELGDLWGDGWDEGLYLITDADGNLIASGNLDTAADNDGMFEGTQLICLPSGDYQLEILGGMFPQEIVWELICTGTGEYDGIGEEGPVDFSVDSPNCAIGCTDPLADNYDPAAEVDFGCYTLGCTSENADNYNSSATEDDGSKFPEAIRLPSASVIR
ncbi:MAG: hypothetical protein AAF193_05050, partial [Bacteroidota bacterium]